MIETRSTLLPVGGEERESGCTVLYIMTTVHMYAIYVCMYMCVFNHFVTGICCVIFLSIISSGMCNMCP